MNTLASKERIILLVLVCSFLFILPLMLANTPYVDDIYRSQSGVIGWKGLGRPLAELVMLLLNFNLTHYFIVDLSPLPLILSGLVLSVSVFHLVNYFDIKWEVTAVLPFLFIIFNPFFIHNLAYKFDCLPMALAVAASIFAFSFDFSRSWRSWFIPAGLIFSSLALYQPSANVYLALVFLSVVLGIAKLSGLRQIVQQAIGKISIFAVIYLGYYFCFSLVSRFAKSAGGSSRSELVSLDASGLDSIYHNILELTSLVKSLYDGRLGIIALVVLFIALVGLVMMAIQYGKHARSGKMVLPVAVLLIMMLVAAFLSSIGPLLLLKNPFVMPRAMTGYSIFLVVVFYSVFYLFGAKRKWPSYFLAGLALVYSFVCMSAFSNAIKLQYDFDNKVITSIHDRLQSESQWLTVSRVMVTGVSPQTHEVKNIVKAFPYLRYMVAPMYDWTATTMLGGMGLSNAYFKFERDEYKLVFSKMCSDSAAKKFDSGIYTIYSAFDYTVIKLKGESKDMCQ